MMSQLGDDYRCPFVKKEDQHDHGSSFRANLEAERNNFMLYLRGEVFIRAALVKVKSAEKLNPILTYPPRDLSKFHFSRQS